MLPNVSISCVQGLVRLADKYPIIDVRGRGLMCAVEFGGHDGSMTASPGVAAALTKAAGKRNMLLLTAGKPLFAPTALTALRAHPAFQKGTPTLAHLFRFCGRMVVTQPSAGHHRGLR